MINTKSKHHSSKLGNLYHYILKLIEKIKKDIPVSKRKILYILFHLTEIKNICKNKILVYEKHKGEN